MDHDHRINLLARSGGGADPWGTDVRRILTRPQTTGLRGDFERAKTDWGARARWRANKDVAKMSQRCRWLSARPWAQSGQRVNAQVGNRIVTRLSCGNATEAVGMFGAGADVHCQR